MSTALQVLVVENSANDAILIRHALGSADAEIRCRVVESLDELRECLESASWDCVLSDFDLGGFTALDVITAVRGLDPDVPVVVVTGAISEDRAVELLRRGAQSYVMKHNLIRLPVVVLSEISDTESRRAHRRAEVALLESEARYRAVVEDQVEPVVRWRPDGLRLFVNHAYCKLCGRSADELLATRHPDSMCDGERSELLAALPTLDPLEPVLRMQQRLESETGETVWLEWTHRGIFDEEGRLLEIQSVGHDVTARVLAAEAERQRYLLVDVLRDTASALNSTLDVNDVLDRILANIAWVIPHDASSIVFIEGDAAHPVRGRGWEGRDADDEELAVPLGRSELRVLEGMFTSGVPLVIADTAEYSLWPGERPYLRWVRSFAAAPLFDEARVMGFLALFSARPRYFSELHLQLLEGFAHHASIATRNARSFEAMSRSRLELRSLAVHGVAAQEEERRRISRELHDEVGQALTAIIVNSDVVRSRLGGTCDPSLRERLEDTMKLARETLQQIRGLSLRLRPAILDDLGIVAAVRWFTTQFSQRMNLSVSFEETGMEDGRLPTELELTLYRVVQEGLTNVAKHARARHVEVRIERSEHHLYLRVADDGVGFPAPISGAPPASAVGLGLLGIRERVAAVDGRLALSSGPGRGTAIEVSLPLDGTPQQPA